MAAPRLRWPEVAPRAKYDIPPCPRCAAGVSLAARWADPRVAQYFSQTRCPRSRRAMRLVGKHACGEAGACVPALLSVIAGAQDVSDDNGGVGTGELA